MIELSKLMGEEWNSLTDNVKKRYQAKAAEQKAEYQLKVDAALNRDKPVVSALKKPSAATPAPLAG